MADADIRHVVLLMLESRSFDHMVGDLQRVYPDLDGIDPAAPHSNRYQAKNYPQDPGAARFVAPDPRHEYEHVMVQVQKDAHGMPNSGFVQNYAQAYPNADDNARREIMRYHGYSSLKALHTLAENFTICDHWYAPVPGPTWPNRLFAMSGTSLGRVRMPEGRWSRNQHWYDQLTLFDRLNEKKRTWKVYFGDFPLSFLLVHQWEYANQARHRRMTEFFRDAAGDPAMFPEFALIEPAYMPRGANDDHPPQDIFDVETMVASVYNAIRSNDALWKQTLLLVLYDEHGGFYDHEPPIATIPPDYHQEDGFQFNLSGIRVPALLVSPWIPKGVLPTPFDHTSLLKYLIDKWSLGPLGKRAAQAKTFKDRFLAAARDDTPSFLDVQNEVPMEEPPALRTLSSNQQAIVALSHALESLVDESAETVKLLSRQISGSREEKMPKSPATSITPASLEPKQALRALRILQQKGHALLSNRPLEKNAAEAWANTVREMLIRAFSSDSDNVRNFSQVTFYRYPKIDTPVGQEELRAEVLGDHLSILGSCIEQLELISGEIDEPPTTAPSRGNRVFIGHGGDPAWRELKDFVVGRLGLEYEEFNREPTAGIPTAERLQKMLEQSAFALIVMTGEDEHGDGKQHARENVIHEIGLFQGHLSFRRAIILLEEECEEFSNIAGVTQIRFQKGKIGVTFEEIRRTLEREGLLPT